MRIDSHQHFWQLSRFHYPWLAGAGEVLKRDFLPADLEPLLEAAGVNKTVLVQAHQSVEETIWLLDLAKQNEFIAGVVGWVDLNDCRVGDTLDRLCAEPYFKGVRHVWHDEPNEDWIMQPQVIRGLRELADREIPYDFLTFPSHLKYIPRVLEEVPQLRSVVDHISKPPIASGELEPWRQDLRLISSHPGVHCKVSGMVTEADHSKWKVQDLEPYVGAVVEIFGPERLMFGSDWPVCLLAASYGQVIDAAGKTLAGLSENHKEAVLGTT
ncbi:MAG: amidohydrolase family protein, partial [bacterium]